MLLFILFYSFLLMAENSDTSNIILPVKQSTPLPISTKTQIFVEDGSVIKLLTFSGKYHVLAKKIGSTRIFTKSENFIIHSLDVSDYNYFTKLKTITSEMRGLSVSWQDGCTLLTGKLLRISDLEKIHEQIKGNNNKNCKNSFKNQASIDTSLIEDFDNYLKIIFQTQNLLVPTYKLQPHLQFFIPLDDLTLYQTRMADFGFLFLADAKTIATIPNIETEIIVTELRKKDLQTMGISWPASVEVQLSQKKVETLPFSWNLHAIEENGHGKILASPKIVSVGGKEAEFLAGGEIPLRAVGFKRNEVIWKSYGILLKVLPQVDAQMRLRLKLSIEVSTLDPSQKVDGLPGFLTNRISSEFFINDNEVLILSGLLKEQSGLSKQGLPGLIHIPILGKLFGSEEYLNNKTELVILVRPRIQVK